MIKIQEFLEQNKTEVWNELIELDLIDQDDIDDGFISIDDLDCKQTGCYEKGDDLVPTDKICGIMEGWDLSFNRKYVTDKYGDANEFILIVNGKTIHGLRYNV